MNVKLTASQKIKVANANDVYKIMQQVLLRESKIRRIREHFWVVGLNNANMIQFIELISLGAHNRVNVNPHDVFRMGIYKLSTKIILVHNHPGGNINPSAADSDFTDRMLKAGKALKFDVIDHLIISETEFFSYKEAGEIDILRNNRLYEVLSPNELERLKQAILKEGQFNAVQKNKLDTAKKMKAEGLNENTIKKVTGLKLSDIKAL